MHSKLYFEWMNNEEDAAKNIQRFLDENKIIFCFTREDIWGLVQNKNYKILFERKILSKQVLELLIILPTEEVLSFFENSCFRLQNAMITLFLSHISRYKELLLQIPFDEQWGEVFSKTFTKIFCVEDDCFLKNILSSKELLELIFQYFPYFYFRDAYKILQKVKSSPFFDELYAKYKENVYWGFLKKISMYESFKDTFLELPMIIDDLCRMEKMELYEVKRLKPGSFCEVYCFHHLILKIGHAHTYFELSNSENLVYPMKRLQRETLKLYLEVTELTDTFNITEWDVYEVYKRERLKGRIWWDAKPSNLGRLLRTNNSYGFYVDPKAVGLIGENKKQLAGGKLAIIDLDHLFEEGKIPNDYTLPIYEEWFQKEMAMKRRRSL